MALQVARFLHVMEVPAIVFLELWFVLQFVSGVGSIPTPNHQLPNTKRTKGSAFAEATADKSKGTKKRC